MFLACKYYELYPPVISDFIQMTKNSFTKSQLLMMESQVISHLDFKFYHTPPISLLESYTLAIRVS